MRLHRVRAHPSAAPLPRESQLAWAIAEVAADDSPVDAEARDMVVNRVIDNAAVALAAVNRPPVANARSQALAHPRRDGATLVGLRPAVRVEAEWAAWANAAAVRELDFHDTFLAAEFGHPGDSIPPLVAVAQQCERSGADLVRGILAAYDVHVGLMKGMCLHAHRIDHVTHLAPAQAAGIGAVLGLAPEIVYQAVQHAVHVSTATRQSRKGAISSWKAYAPAHTAKLAVEAVDRAMRGETAPSPVYEGEDGLIAWLLDGPEAAYEVPLPEPGEARRAILETWTKAHAAEYQAQALIDLAFRLRGRIPDTGAIESVVIHASHHTHQVIGTGSGDPQKFDPAASRETLDHSAMYCFAVALQDGRFHHVESFAPERAARADTVDLWRRVSTREDPEWTARYHDPVPARRAYGGRVELRLRSGETVIDEIAVADAHPLGARPFRREDYVEKFAALAEGVITDRETARFLAAAQRLPELEAGDLGRLNPAVPPGLLECAARDRRGIF